MILKTAEYSACIEEQAIFCLIQRLKEQNVCWDQMNNVAFFIPCCHGKSLFKWMLQLFDPRHSNWSQCTEPSHTLPSCVIHFQNNMPLGHIYRCWYTGRSFIRNPFYTNILEFLSDGVFHNIWVMHPKMWILRVQNVSFQPQCNNARTGRSTQPPKATSLAATGEVQMEEDSEDPEIVWTDPNGNSLPTKRRKTWPSIHISS